MNISEKISTIHNENESVLIPFPASSFCGSLMTKMFCVYEIFADLVLGEGDFTSNSPGLLKSPILFNSRLRAVVLGGVAFELVLTGVSHWFVVGILVGLGNRTCDCGGGVISSLIIGIGDGSELLCNMLFGSLLVTGSVDGIAGCSRVRNWCTSGMLLS